MMSKILAFVLLVVASAQALSSDEYSKNFPGLPLPPGLDNTDEDYSVVKIFEEVKAKYIENYCSKKVEEKYSKDKQEYHTVSKKVLKALETSKINTASTIQDGLTLLRLGKLLNEALSKCIKDSQ